MGLGIAESLGSRVTMHTTIECQPTSSLKFLSRSSPECRGNFPFLAQIIPLKDKKTCGPGLLCSPGQVPGVALEKKEEEKKRSVHFFVSPHHSCRKQLERWRFSRLHFRRASFPGKCSGGLSTVQAISGRWQHQRQWAPDAAGPGDAISPVPDSRSSQGGRRRQVEGRQERQLRENVPGRRLHPGIHGHGKHPDRTCHDFQSFRYLSASFVPFRKIAILAKFEAPKSGKVGNRKLAYTQG